MFTARGTKNAKQPDIGAPTAGPVGDRGAFFQVRPGIDRWIVAMIYSLSIYHEYETERFGSGVVARKRGNARVGAVSAGGFLRLSDSEGVGPSLPGLYSVPICELVPVVGSIGAAGAGQGAVGKGGEGAGAADLPDHGQGAGGASGTGTRMASVFPRDGTCAGIGVGSGKKTSERLVVWMVRDHGVAAVR